MHWLTGGVTSPSGFLAGGIHSGIKDKDADLALIVSELNAVCCACFTRSKTKAAPVILSRDNLDKSDTIKAVLINSGCANAGTGVTGFNDAMEMTALTARLLGVEPVEVLVCSTGRIGGYLPMDKVKKGITKLIPKIHYEGSNEAAKAIMTTDTYSKESACKVLIGGVDVKIGAIAKGSGMIAPDMATMLAVLTTDASVDQLFLKSVLNSAVDRTFNRITVDGDTSTNDSVIMMANGMAENSIITESSPEAQYFKDAVFQVCRNLALQIVRDGEGATKCIEIFVSGAEDKLSARNVARTVANSLLLKVAFNGADPNWGRIMAAIGRSDARFDPYKVNILLDDLCIVKCGVGVDNVIDQAKSIWSKKDFKVIINLNNGNSSDSYYTCDISHDYIDINV